MKEKKEKLILIIYLAQYVISTGNNIKIIEKYILFS